MTEAATPSSSNRNVRLRVLVNAQVERDLQDLDIVHRTPTLGTWSRHPSTGSTSDAQEHIFTGLFGEGLKNTATLIMIMRIPH